MKKNFFSLIIFLTLCSSIFALDNNYLSFTITPRFEIVNGSINEYVYDKDCLNTDNKLSQLDWDIKNIPFFSLKGEVDIIKYIHFDIDGGIGVPKISGYMQDYDWLNSFGGKEGIPYSWRYEDPTAITNYSKHTNKLEQYMTFTLGIGANVFLPAEIKLSPKIAYQYEFIYFSGTGGYKTYKADNWVQYNFTGKVISYKQEINSMLTGISITVDTISKAHFSADLMFSPKMTFLNAIDYHHAKSKAYWDNFKNLWQIKANIEAQYKFNKYHCAGLSTSIQYIPVSVGDTRQKNIESDGSLSEGPWGAAYVNSGGTSRLIWSIGLNYSFSL